MAQLSLKFCGMFSSLRTSGKIYFWNPFKCLEVFLQRIINLKREQRQLETFQKRQHKLKLRQKTKVIQEELEEDRSRLQEMEELTKLQDEVLQEKRDKAMQEVIWMRGVVEEQASEERRRENEAETMYAEEAEKMWEKQEEVWRREATARKRLMEEVRNCDLGGG